MSELIKNFTRELPDWKPRVKPVNLDEATEAQLDALKVTPSNTKVSDYVLTLAHDVESLKIRSPLFNAIMYDKGGLKRSERELGAIGASVLNRCIYCNAVHMNRHAQLEKDTSVTDSILADGENAKLSSRDQAMFNFSLKLANSFINVIFVAKNALDAYLINSAALREVFKYFAPLDIKGL